MEAAALAGGCVICGVRTVVVSVFLQERKETDAAAV